MPVPDAVCIEDSDNDSIANVQDEDQKQQLKISSATNMHQKTPKNDIQQLESNTQLNKVFIINLYSVLEHSRNEKKISSSN